ncbi:MAG: hypothetical protein ACI4CX_05355 [Candidatus Weimeria sp.]
MKKVDTSILSGEQLESFKELNSIAKGKKVKCNKCGMGYYQPIIANAPLDKCYTFVCPKCGDMVIFTPDITVE